MINKALNVSLRLRTILKKEITLLLFPTAERKEKALWGAGLTPPGEAAASQAPAPRLPSAPRSSWPAHHPSQPQAGLAGRPHGHAPGGNIWRSLQRLDDAGGLAEGAGAHHVHLPHPEPGAEGKTRCTL